MFALKHALMVAIGRILLVVKHGKPVFTLASGEGFMQTPHEFF